MLLNILSTVFLFPTDCDRDYSHTIKECKPYSSPEDKVSRLESINGCLRCGYADHRKCNCKFRFTQKCTCNYYHFAFLFLHNSKINGTVKDSRGKNSEG